MVRNPHPPKKKLYGYTRMDYGRPATPTVFFGESSLPETFFGESRAHTFVKLAMTNLGSPVDQTKNLGLENGMIHV